MCLLVKQALRGEKNPQVKQIQKTKLSRESMYESKYETIHGDKNQERMERPILHSSNWPFFPKENVAAEK